MQRPRADGATASAAEAIVHAYGSDTLAYFALRDDKSLFFSSDGKAMIAYTYLRGLRARLGRPDRRPRSRSPWSSTSSSPFCRERGWQLAFLAVREADMPLYAERGLHAVYLGDEAIIRCDRSTPRARA